MRQGAKVVAVDIRQEQLDKRVSELKQYGNEVIGVVGDVLDVASLGKLAGQVLSQWGKIDILLNIAGGNMPGATLEPEQHFYDMDIACWEKVTGLNMNCVSVNGLRQSDGGTKERLYCQCIFDGRL